MSYEYCYFYIVIFSVTFYVLYSITWHFSVLVTQRKIKRKCDCKFCHTYVNITQLTIETISESAEVIL